MESNSSDNKSGGYDRQETPQRYSDFGSDFISLGSSGDYRGQNRSGRGKGRSQWRRSFNSSTPRRTPHSDSPQSDYTPRNSPYGNSFSNSSPYDSSPVSSSRFQRHPNRRNKSHTWNRGSNQGGRKSDFNCDISMYFHPSMVENPWRDLERLYQTPLSAQKHDAKDESSKYTAIKTIMNSEEIPHSPSDSELSNSS